MLRVVALVLAGLATTALPAAARPSSVAMTCAQSAGLVRAHGAIVLGTGGRTYDRFVSDRRFCQPTEETRAAFVPTRDRRSCFVGYRCFEPSNRRSRF